ncbi:MAG: hydroxysqualene dehydroxylase HpnE [Bauldia litoralis]
MSRAGPTGGRAHVVGAGLAGLSAAIRLTEAGWPVTIYESARHAGGRCRSYFDDTLGCRIDNGNHLLLAGNRSAMAYLDTIGARDALETVAPARIPFVDLDTGERWTLRPNAGPVGWWVFAPGRRAPGTRAGDYLAALKLRGAAGKTMADLFDPARPAYRRFWEPMAVAVLNTAADEAAAGLLWPVMTEIVLRGEAAFRPCIARDGLSEAFVDPALAWLAARGGEVRFNARCRSAAIEDGRVAALDFGTDRVTVGRGDTVVLAVPPAAAGTLLPDLTVPDDYRPIVNVHFRCPQPLPMPGDFPLLGLIGGTAQWIFRRGEIVSVTISAAAGAVDLPGDVLIGRVWADIRAALSLGNTPSPPARILTEKRATIAQTPAQVARRPAARTPLANLFLAGDWTDTGLPATIEGAIRSGAIAAHAAGARRH